MIAVKINPLREFHYPTWDDLGHALGFEARSLANHRSLPSNRRKGASAKLKAAVDSLFEQKFPFPLPHHQQITRQRLTAAKRDPGSVTLLNVIEEIEGYVADFVPAQPFHAAGMKYLGYLARHARAVLCKSETAATPNAAFGDKKRLRTSLADAITDLQEGRAIITRALDQPNPIPEESALKELDAVLFLNWVVAIGSYIPGDPPPNPAELTIKFHACDALGTFRAALQQLPYEWRVPYNGLDIASRLRADDNDLWLFYSRLCDFDSGFRDFDYRGLGEVKSIAKNPELEFFRQRCRLNPAIMTPIHKD